ncbi:MAG: aromatic ring-hydroxylating dioxygenase subunit alpha [Pseudomonadota bacterium]
MLTDNYRITASASLENAISLPFSVYRDQDVYTQEMERIFRNDWVFVCFEQEIPDVGNYFALELAGESIAIIRGNDGHIRALSNNCRHRGTPLLDEGFGSIEKLIVCPYHAWAYDDKGALKGAPFSGTVKIEKEEHCLPEFLLGIHLGMVFVHLGDAVTPLESRLSGLAEFAAVFQPERFDSASESTREIWQANWKLAMENAMESYHLFKVHTKTLETVTPTKQSYYVAGSAEWTLTGGKMIDNSSAFSKWFRGDYPEAYEHYLLVSLPPNFVGIMTYDSFGWLSVNPTSFDQCEIRAGAIFSGGHGVEDSTAKEFTQAFFEEDKWICERVQRGMRSQNGSGGKLVEMERVVVDFHQYLASRLFGEVGDGFFENPDDTVFKNYN